MPYKPRLPKFNHYSFDLERESKGKLLKPQADALKSLEEFFHQNPMGLTAMISMPTGSGKSGVISCLPYFLGKTGLTPPPEDDAPPYRSPLHLFDKPVLVIAPDLAIAKQLEGSLLRVQEGEQEDNFLLRRGIVPEEYARDVLPVGKKVEETFEVTQPNILKGNEIVIANAQKFLGKDWKECLPNNLFRLIIVDEAHHHPAETWRQIVEHFKDHAMVVFFTATPFRGDGNLVLKEGEGKIIHRLSLKEARDQRIIRPTYFDPVDGDDETHPEDEISNDLDEIYREILRRVHAIQEGRDKNHPLPDGTPHMAIAITKDTAEAERVARAARQIWKCSPAQIPTYHSKLQEYTRQAIMRAIRANRIKLVVVVSMLLEGFDHPPISIAAIMTKIVSTVKFVQFIGRAQRIIRGKDREPESKDITAHIVTHSKFEQERNYKLFESENLIPDDTT